MVSRLHVVLPPAQRVDRAARWHGWPLGSVTIAQPLRDHAPPDLAAAVDLSATVAPEDWVLLPSDLEIRTDIPLRQAAQMLSCTITYALHHRATRDARRRPAVIDVCGSALVLSARWLTSLAPAIAALRQVPERRRRTAAWRVDASRRMVMIALQAAKRAGADLRAMRERIVAKPADIGLFSAFPATKWRRHSRDQEHLWHLSIPSTSSAVARTPRHPSAC